MISYNSKYFISFAALAFASSASALTVTPSNDATALAQALIGSNSGITLVDATYSGSTDGSGFYKDGPQGIRDSIVMTSGTAVDVIPGGDPSVEISKDKNGPASPLLCGQLNGGVNTYDASVLTMNVVLGPTYTGFFSEFVFTTEEYPEWIGSDFNDVFGIWIDGKQIATDSSNAPITINGPFFKSDAVLTPPASGSSMDGSTPLLTAGYAATPGAHKIEIAICDTADSLQDSAVFVTLAGCTGECKSGTVISPCAGKGGDSNGNGICDDDEVVSSSTSSSSSAVVTSPSSINGTITSSSSSSVVTSPSVITSSGIKNSTAVVPTSSVVLTSLYANSTITSGPSTETPPCVTYTSYVIKTITTCTQQTICHPTTTASPTVVTSTLQLTVYTPCSTVTVSKCPGGPGSPCVTYTNTVTYPAITGYPPIPTYTAPVHTIPYSNNTAVHGCPGGVNCPKPSSSVYGCPGGVNCPQPSPSTIKAGNSTAPACPGGANCPKPTTTVTLSYTSQVYACPGGTNCPPAATSAATSVATKPSQSCSGASCPKTTSTPVAVFTGAATKVSGMGIAVVAGFVIAAFAAL